MTACCFSLGIPKNLYDDAVVKRSASLLFNLFDCPFVDLSVCLSISIYINRCCTPGLHWFQMFFSFFLPWFFIVLNLEVADLRILEGVPIERLPISTKTRATLKGSVFNICMDTLCFHCVHSVMETNVQGLECCH